MLLKRLPENTGFCGQYSLNENMLKENLNSFREE
jgi:hypothetical protein